MISQWRGMLVDTRVWFGCDMASAKRKHITRVWQSPQQGPGAEPLVRGSGGKAPGSWNFLRPWTTNGDRKFV